MRSGLAGKIAGIAAPGRSSHARPMRAIRSRTRPSGCVLRAYSRPAQSVSSSMCSAGAARRSRVGAAHKRAVQSVASGFIHTARAAPPADPGGWPEVGSEQHCQPAAR